MNTDAELREILSKSRAIAIVGASPLLERDSHDMMDYLQQEVRSVKGELVHPSNLHRMVNS